mmetsp:Transcript_4364/g.9880  ORF Transcript_4364/g.9880 Transcript_4364/m.9880 type:complete len:256 (-) Transcript_4364:22993-23760(-)
MSVGKVKNVKILPNKKHRVLVTFETIQEVTLTDKTTAQLVSSSLLGNKAIDLLIQEGNPLTNYDTVPGKTEQGLGDAFTENALPALRDVKDFSLLASQFIANLTENMDTINSIFANLEDTTNFLKQTIHHSQQDLHTLSHNMSEVSGALADSRDGIKPLLIKLNRLLEGVQAKEVKKLTENLNHSLNNFKKVIETTGKGQNSLGKLLYNDHLYNHFDRTLNNLDKLLIDLRIHPGRYVHFSLLGRKKSCKKIKVE